MVKKLSLKEFYENGNTKPLIALLPSKPGDARDSDQSCYNSKPSRLAELSLDSRISRPHDQFSNGPAYGAGYGGTPSHAHVAHHHPGSHNYGGNGGPVASGPYGDDDYYGSSSGSASNIRRPFGGAPPSPYSRGPYAPRAPGSGTGLAGLAALSASGPAGSGVPAAMGSGAVGSAHNGGGQQRGPHGRTPADYGTGPNRPCAAPDDEDVWYPPPPPPPPRACLSPNSQQSGASAVQHRAAAPYADAPAAATGSAKGHQEEPVAAHQAKLQPAPEPATVRVAAPHAAARSAGDGVAKTVVPAPHVAPPPRHSSSGVVELAVASTEAASQGAADKAAATSPFAAVPTPAGPKNEFAERLAQKALANATRGKSSLLASGSASSWGSALSGCDALVPSAPDSASGEGAFVKPSHPFGKPRLVLKPRCAAATAADSSRATTPLHQGCVSSSASSDSGTEAGEQGSIASSSVGSARPRLNLKPRTLPLPDEHATANSNGCSDKAAASSGRHCLNLLPRGSSTVPAADGIAARKAAVFGAAKPKDLPDPVLMDGASARSGSSRLSEAAVARLGSAGNTAGGRWGGSSSVSGGERDDDWHTVHGRKGGAKGSTGSALADDLDPFFGHASSAGSKLVGGGSGHVSVPAPRAFDREIMRSSFKPYSVSNGHGRYGGSYDEDGYSGSVGKRSSPGGGWGGRGVWNGEDDAEAEADGGVFMRALPTRQGPFAL